jgi:hypothetical protein
MDVGGWLRNLGLGKYEAAFRDNAIDEQVLRHLTAEDLKEIGVATVGDRRKLLAAIAELAAPSPSAEPRSPPSAAERPKTLRPRPSGVRSQAELGKVSAPRFETCDMIAAVAPVARGAPTASRGVPNDRGRFSRGDAESLAV